MVIHDGYPRPETQIPVLSSDGLRRYYLDMGWRDLMLALEYEGDHHRTDRTRFAYEIERAEDIRDLGWMVIRVAARSHPEEVRRRVSRAWDSLTG
jgi:very-short-patch-repair endonuclease